jgi:Family of unknown function (DUF5689)
MKGTSKFLSLSAMVLFLLMATTSCVKQKFDQPPANGTDPNLTPTHSISMLKSMYHGIPVKITDDIIVEGIVVGDDKSGNFYKQIVIEDDSAGIALLLDGTNLYTNYPVGRKIFIKCKGLYISSYNNLIQLCGYFDYTVSPPKAMGIPSTVFTNYIFPGTWNNTVAPRVVTLSDLSSNSNMYQNMLVQINDAEFKSTDAGQNYADPINLLSVNRTVEECGGASMIVRTSGYCNFAGISTPVGKGSLKAIYTVFGATSQLIVRDTTDVQFTGTRCGGGGGTATLVTIASIRSTTIPSPPDSVILGAIKIRGIVTSDGSNANTASSNMVIQDGTAGINLHFAGSHSFNMGDEVEIILTGQTLNRYKGLLEVTPVPLGNASLISVGNTVTPRVATIADITTNYNSWESTLVTVNGATLTPAGTYSGNKTIGDGTGSFVLYTRTAATFAGMTMPTGTVSVTGTLGQYTSSGAPNIQLSIRNPTIDVH